MRLTGRPGGARWLSRRVFISASHACCAPPAAAACWGGQARRRAAGWAGRGVGGGGREGLEGRRTPSPWGRRGVHRRAALGEVGVPARLVPPPAGAGGGGGGRGGGRGGKEAGGGREGFGGRTGRAAQWPHT